VCIPLAAQRLQQFVSWHIYTHTDRHKYTHMCAHCSDLPQLGPAQSFLLATMMGGQEGPAQDPKVQAGLFGPQQRSVAGDMQSGVWCTCSTHSAQACLHLAFSAARASYRSPHPLKAATPPCSTCVQSQKGGHPQP